jgi:hypothetical protein
MNIAYSALGLVGDTPLVRLNRVAAGLPAQVVAKLEFYFRAVAGIANASTKVSSVSAAEITNT